MRTQAMIGRRVARRKSGVTWQRVERKQVTVLFADPKGSMELLADRDPEEAHKLLDPVLERMMEAVHRYKESVRSLVNDRGLAGERGADRLVKTSETIHVPATAQAILAARIDRLPPEDKALLQTASVVGTDVPVAVLAAVTGGPADAPADGLARLQAAAFLYETSLFPDTEYTFKHALTDDVGACLRGPIGRR